jgi:hypothetical protein
LYFSMSLSWLLIQIGPTVHQCLNNIQHHKNHIYIYIYIYIYIK